MNYDTSLKQSNKQHIVSIILAAGKGTRMQSPHLPKVCHTLRGKPVIERAIETYRRCGIRSHFIVVGYMAEQVMQVASDVDKNVFFCYQTEQRGTGHAAKTAAHLLDTLKYDGNVLVAAGDKVIEENMLIRLVDRFYDTDKDLLFLVGNKNDFPNSGRVFYSKTGKPEGIIEVFDLAKVKLIDTLKRIAADRNILASEAETIVYETFPQEKKAALALGPIWESIKKGKPVSGELLQKNCNSSDFKLLIHDQAVSPQQLLVTEHANLSVYLFKARALYYSLSKLNSHKAQEEEYLTDVVEILSAKDYKIGTIAIDHPHLVMAFNTPEELDKIEKFLSNQK